MGIGKLYEIYLGVVVNTKGEVLINKRTKIEKGTGEVSLSWAFPGGGAMEGENFKDTLKRELLEETGYLVVFKKMLSERSIPSFLFIFIMRIVFWQTKVKCRFRMMKRLPSSDG